jgi:hypothetical protein
VQQPTPWDGSAVEARPLRQRAPAQRRRPSSAESSGAVLLRAALWCACVARRLVRLEHPLDRPPVDPKPGGDPALRDPVRRHRPRLRPLHHAAHLLAPPVSPVEPVERASSGGRHRRGGWCTFRCPIPVQYWAPGVSRAATIATGASCTAYCSWPGGGHTHCRSGGQCWNTCISSSQKMHRCCDWHETFPNVRCITAFVYSRGAAASNRLAISQGSARTPPRSVPATHCGSDRHSWCWPLASATCPEPRGGLVCRAW